MDYAQLCAAVRAGKSFKYLFFWGHKPQADGGLATTCFSQWFEYSFAVDGVHYPTAEHYMMAEKARLFGDSATLAKILAAASPGEAKKLGRSVTPWDQERWSERRFDIVVRGNLAKFASGAMRDFLLGTGERVIVEASPRDRIWGIGMGAKNPKAGDPHEWRGLNLLGFALMEARQRLRSGAA